MYKDYKYLETGNIILCRTKNSLEARVINFVLGSYWNHAVVILKLGGQVFVVEAKGQSTIKAIPFTSWYKSLDREIKVIPTTCERTDIVPYLGLEYDYLSVFEYVLRYLGIRFKESEDKIFCFELIARIYKLSNPEETKPQDLENLTL